MGKGRKQIAKQIASRAHIRDHLGKRITNMCLRQSDFRKKCRKIKFSIFLKIGTKF
jgi:hypothetical protein